MSKTQIKENAMSNAFASALEKTVNNEETLSENGAVMFKTSSNKLVDCNFALSSFRQKTEAEVIKAFSEAWNENREYALRWLFMARDVREGSGERRTFRIILKWLAQAEPALVGKLVKEVAEYGRFDDLYCLFGTPAEKAVVENVFAPRLCADLVLMDENKPVSLLAKWLKSPNASSPETKALAKRTYRAMGMTEKAYRKRLSRLRAYIDVVEAKMSAKKWGDIDYQKVPSQANLKYKAAFLKNDGVRRREYLSKLEKGEAKINAAACFPSDIVYKYMTQSCGYANPEADAQLEAMWKALPKIGGDDMNVITVVDVSGSMTWTKCANSGMRPLDVALALGVYCAENLKGPFRNKAITFSERPEYVKLPENGTLIQKLGTLVRSQVSMSTNVKAVMDLVLKTATDNGLKQEDIPAVVILSDMEFNEGTRSGGYGYDADKKALFAEIADEWKAAGYSLPKLYFWNLNSRTGGIPIQFNKNGVGLVSGYSQNTVKMLLSDKLDPWEILKEQLDVPRYARISEIADAE